jgi:hypothetical protein
VVNRCNHTPDWLKEIRGMRHPAISCNRFPVRFRAVALENMINSVQMDFSVLLRCNGNEIGSFGILDQLILSNRSDSVGEDEHRQQCLAVYHHREVNSRILVVGE